MVARIVLMLTGIAYGETAQACAQRVCLIVSNRFCCSIIETFTQVPSSHYMGS